MKIVFVKDFVATLTYWNSNKKEKQFKFFSGDEINDAGITPDMFNPDYITISVNKSSFSIPKDFIKIS